MAQMWHAGRDRRKVSVVPTSLEAALNRALPTTEGTLCPTCHSKPAGNPAARTAQQQAARNAQIRTEQNRQRQPRPANPESPDHAEADGE